MIKDFNSIIFHSPCSDGVSALWASCHYKDISNKIQCKAGVNPKSNFSNQNIVFVDICPSFDYIVSTALTANYILILDHHKSASDMYNNNKSKFDKLINVKFIFDMERSGCQMAWDYFFDNKPRPWFIDYIADRDLWKWELENSREINTALHENNIIDPTNLVKLDNLLIDEETKKNNLITDGKIILQLQKKELDFACNKSIEATMTVNNITYRLWLGGNLTNSLRSDLGNILSKKVFSDNTLPNFAAIWMYEPKLNEWWISLRGSNNCPDLSIITTFLGGGGHPKAAGFTIKNGKHLKDFFNF